MRLAEKYKPQKLSEVVGQREAISKLLQWLSKWEKGRAVIFHGPPGVGKTALVQALARERNFELLEITEEKAEVMITAAKQHSLTRKQKIILLENADFFDIKFAMKIIQNSIFPVILTVDDIYSAKSRSLRQFCDVIEFKRIPSYTMEKKLKEVALAESMEIPAKFLAAATGDLRAALIDLDSGLDVRDREPTAFEVLRAIFKGSIADAEKALESSSENLSVLLRWVEENIPAEFTDANEKAEAFELLSKVDLMRKRNQNALKMLAGFTKIHKTPPPRFTPYSPPSMRQIKLNENISGAALHCSEKKAQRESWLLEKLHL